MNNSLTPPALFKALADETRARAVLMIHQEDELCVCELVCALAQSQPKISRHLAQLRTCGLLLDRREGQWVYYRLNPNLDEWVKAVLDTTLSANHHWRLDDIERLAQMGERPLRSATCG